MLHVIATLEEEEVGYPSVDQTVEALCPEEEVEVDGEVVEEEAGEVFEEEEGADEDEDVAKQKTKTLPVLKISIVKWMIIL